MKINCFRVVPALPERLSGLREIAYNLRWSWDDDLRTVFSRLDRDLRDAYGPHTGGPPGSLGRRRRPARRPGPRRFPQLVELVRRGEHQPPGRQAGALGLLDLG